MAITFIEGADMSEAKTPEPGEYWVSDDGGTIRIVGVKLNGGVIYENQAGFSFQFNSMTNWHYEPRCTGFNWTEPPAIDPGEGWELLPVGTVLREGDQFEAIGKWMNTNNAGRKKLPGWTYRRKIKPVESPNDWVEITDRDHKLRASIDEFRNSHEWAYVRDSHGKTARQAGFLNVRCRRKDLPVLVTCTCPTLDGVPVTGSACPIHGLPSCELTTAAKRVPVRLWINGDDGVVFQSEVHVNADDQEIKHDADGFYVTEGQL